MLKFFARIFCFIFAHKPIPVMFGVAATDTEPAKNVPGDLQVMTLGQGQNTIAVVVNCCGRCDELVRHKAREIELTKTIRQHLARKAMEEKAKAAGQGAQNESKARAWDRRQRGESGQAYKERMKGPNPFRPEAKSAGPKLVPAPAPEPEPTK